MISLRKVVAFSLGPIGVAIISLATVPLVAWVASPDDVGKFSMLQLGINFCLLIFSLGLDQAYVREYHTYPNKAALFLAAAFPGFALLCICLSLAAFWPNVISRTLFGVDQTQLSFFAGVCFIAAYAFRFLSLIFRMQERGVIFSFGQILPKAIVLLFLSYFLLYSATLTLRDLLIAQMFGFGGAVLALTWFARVVTSFRSFQYDKNLSLSMLKFGLPLIVSGGAFWAMTSMDRVFLRKFSTFDELGVYSIANSFAGVAIVVQNIFSTMWAPSVFKLHAEGVDSSVIQQFGNRVVAVAVLCYAFAGAFSWVIGILLPVKYESCQFIFLAALAYPFFYTIGESTSIGLGLARKTHHVMFIGIFGLCICFFANYLLVPRFGGAGAASATAVAFWATFILRTEIACRVWYPIARKRLYALTTGIAWLAIANALTGVGYATQFRMLWVFVFFGLVYLFNKEILAIVLDFRNSLSANKFVTKKV